MNAAALPITAQDAAERRAKITAADLSAETGIDEAMIESLRVRGFV